MLQNARVTAFTVSELLRENAYVGGWGWVKKRDVREMYTWNMGGFLYHIVCII